MTLALKAFAWFVFGFVLMALPLFLAAGTIAWLAGWTYLILLYGWLFIGILLLLRYNPGLLAERINVSPPNQQAWDKVFVVLLNLFLFALLVLMPLDAVRFHWSQMPLWLQVVGAIALVISFVLMSLVFRENSYLSATVRVQEERGQTVITTGLYHYVRHPMYAGALFMFLGTPLLLGSWYGMVLTLLFLPALIVRSVLEERTLLRELPGYSTYMTQVKYRLIPYVW
ncbi:isoprenylcysteine carboxyl methyltransferase [Dictyobacter vulcani]|uniref:Isoprenylcysteine carboxyl methyltransferase n=1 Tax=Dictyobacter vulcani TaxID=2607529 RepID=A0A5J4KJR0_9CHLR|nr:isoprenylcysteine carboxylmethyltransferase family protein [Dictyobacter vulcani]GER89958.1 isoprenylcysteine carboxyl methyltransferase [Dictyobacter vulcani]